VQVIPIFRGLDGGRPHVRDGSVVQVVQEGLLHDRRGALGVVFDDEGDDEPGGERLDGSGAEVGPLGDVHAVQCREGEVPGYLFGHVVGGLDCRLGRESGGERGREFDDVVREGH